jgi:hypothetical protein
LLLLSSLVALVVLPKEVTESQYNFSGLVDDVVEHVLSVEDFPEEVWEILEDDVFLDRLDMRPDSRVMSETFVAFKRWCCWTNGKSQKGFCSCLAEDLPHLFLIG